MPHKAREKVKNEIVQLFVYEVVIIKHYEAPTGAAA